MQSRGCGLLPHRLEPPLHPRVDRLTVLLRGVPTQVTRHVHGLIVEGSEVGWAEHAGLERGAVARDMDQENSLPWQHRRVGGDRDARGGERDGRCVEADLADAATASY